MADLVSAFRKVETIIEASWSVHGCDPEYLSIDDLHDIIQSRFNIAIEMIEVTPIGDRFKGIIERYEVAGKKSAVIYVNTNQSATEVRLTTVKELCHVIVDNKADFNPDGLETLSGLVQGLAPEASEGSLWSERLAVVMANELVYPHEYRAGDAAKIAADPSVLLSLAQRRMVPTFVARNVLSDRYIKVCHDIWARISAEKAA